MNQTIRKLLSIMLAAIMLFALIPAAAAEQEEPAEPIAAEEPTVETETEPEEPAEAPASTEEEPAEVPAEDVQENAEEIEDVDAEKQAAEEKILVNAANFPDAKFLSWVLTKLNPKPEYDSEIGYYLTKENIEKVTTIDCSGQSIGSVKGIEGSADYGLLRAVHVCGISVGYGCSNLLSLLRRKSQNSAHSRCVSLVLGGNLLANGLHHKSALTYHTDNVLK